PPITAPSPSSALRRNFLQPIWVDARCTPRYTGSFDAGTGVAGATRMEAPSEEVKMMRIYGRRATASRGKPLRLHEVTVAASPRTLRRLSEFLLYVAEQMERHGSNFGHEHFEDFEPEARSGAAFVVTGVAREADG